MYGFKIKNGEITLQARGAGLAGLYELTDCSMVEVAAVGTLGGVKVALLCDEEGLLVNSPLVNLTAGDLRNEITESFLPYSLVGTCSLVADDGNLSGFSADDVARITKALDKGGYPYGTSAFTIGGIEVVMFR
jgi:hypothetical protein